MVGEKHLIGINEKLDINERARNRLRDFWGRNAVC